MTDYQVIERGPAHRVIVLPGGERIEQTLTCWTRRTVLAKTDIPEVLAKVEALWREKVVADVSEYSDEPPAYVEFSGWDDYALLDEDGFEHPCLIGYVDAWYWPRVETENAA